MTSRHRPGRLGAAAAGVFAVLLAGAGAAPAHAQTVDSDTYALSGVLSSDTPVTLAPVQTGTLTLTSDCAGLSVDTDSGDVTVVSNGGLGPCISATGAFTSMDCGVVTATMTGTLNASEFSVAGTDQTPESYNVSFTLTMVAGVGLIDGIASETGSTAFSPFAGSFVAPTSDECVDGISTWGVDGAVTTTA